MITSILLSLREGLEAALIIGIVMGALRKTGRPGLNRWLWAGVVSAVIVSLISALLLRAVDAELEGSAEQIFEGITLLLAAGVLTWMVFWMRSEFRSMKTKLESNVSHAASVNSKRGLYFLALMAVLREGIELALYLTAASMSLSGIQTLLGTAIGLSAACLLGYLLYSTTVRLNLKRFFQITGVVLILFASGLIGKSIAEFNEAGIIPTIVSPIWNLHPILSDNSLIGSIFTTLFGYHSSPSLTEVLGYSAYALITLYIFTKANLLQAARFTPHASATFPSPTDTDTALTGQAGAQVVHHTQKGSHVPRT